MIEFAGRVAVVTGAANGIGFGLAEKFAAEGMRVVLSDIEESDLDRAVKELEGRGHDVFGVVADVSKLAQVEALAERALERYGAVHILCNNAGVAGALARMWECSVKDWEWMIGVNQLGVVWGMRTFVPIMLKQDTECHVVNTASMAGLISGSGIYSMTKHAVVALSEGFYVDLKGIGSKIGVSVLLPGVTQTRIWDSASHRPQDLIDPDAAPPPPELQEMTKAMAQAGVLGAGHGQTPGFVAEKVLDCIRKERFWIIPNERYRSTAITRVEAAFEGGSPLPWHELMPGFPGPGW